ncbi:hypothetical protein GALMADRAFT_265964 [Galerina marginata CBS 339.88]|uniref:Peroxidase n=1 Tax=Galerina marginata (strain CBS 339.88) TaxID=685588 RepID=A0A067TKU8_GALM3|nr:hypothetical protein GALMADRAFT_265964 [Galerina marginata CBS 339.88]
MSLGRLAVFVALAALQLGNAAIVSKRSVTCPTGQTTANEACCALFPVIDSMQKDLFEGGECGEDAHAALRLAFHDAIGFSTNGMPLARLSESMSKTRLFSIDDIVARQMPIFLQSNLTAGDFVHLAAAIGTGNCPGAPQLSYSIGRPAPAGPAPDGTVPEPTQSVSEILGRFSDAGFFSAEVIWLLASHSIAAANKIDTSIPGTPFDSTPSTFDTQFFLEVLLNGMQFPGSGQHTGEVVSPLAGEMRLQSDFAFSQDPQTACFWQEAIDDQTFIMARFRDAMQKLQLLGQSGLTDCSDVIPVPKAFSSHITYPGGFNQTDCTALPFPSIATVSGPAPTIPPV